MKLDFAAERLPLNDPAPLRPGVSGETHRLTDVVLCAPSNLATVPCCSVTRESIRNGFSVSMAQAMAQHSALTRTLSQRGVRCHIVPAHPDLADQCFTRDVAVTTPWGLVGLNPALSHRRSEVDQMFAALARHGVQPYDRVVSGTIEGGDVCVARPGLLILGMSGERTTAEGASAFAAPFEKDGWQVLRYAFDPHFLHLDTMFCMLDQDRALACVDVLDDWFIEAITAQGIELIPVSYKASRRLGCNILSLDGKTILMSSVSADEGSSDGRSVADHVRKAGFDVVELDISQFAACGGGIHCLTMPLRREPC